MRPHPPPPCNPPPPPPPGTGKTKTILGILSVLLAAKPEGPAEGEGAIEQVSLSLLSLTRPFSPELPSFPTPIVSPSFDNHLLIHLLILLITRLRIRFGIRLLIHPQSLQFCLPNFGNAGFCPRRPPRGRRRDSYHQGSERRGAVAECHASGARGSGTAADGGAQRGPRGRRRACTLPHCHLDRQVAPARALSRRGAAAPCARYDSLPPPFPRRPSPFPHVLPPFGRFLTPPPVFPFLTSRLFLTSLTPDLPHSLCAIQCSHRRNRLAHPQPREASLSHCPIWPHVTHHTSHSTCHTPHVSYTPPDSRPFRRAAARADCSTPRAAATGLTWCASVQTSRSHCSTCR